MKQYLKCLTIVALVATLGSALSAHKSTPSVQQPTPKPAIRASIKALPKLAKKKAIKVAIKYWKIPMAVNGVSQSRINYAISYYQRMGMTKQGVSYLVGNFIQESGLTTDGCHPDGLGQIACGLAQWHATRRPDMPKGTAQYKWAVNVEMARHSPALKTALFSPKADVGSIIAGIKSWEGYGVEGARYYYGQTILNNLK